MTEADQETRSYTAPRLRGPTAAVVSALAAAGGLAAYAVALPFDGGMALAEFEVAAPGRVDVRPGPAKVSRLLVAAGQSVAAGEVVAEVDTSELDQKMAALKEQAASINKRLDAVRLEAQSFSILLEQRLVSRSRVTELETQVGELERSADELIVKIAMAERQLANAEVRAPIAGIVRDLNGTTDAKEYSAEAVMFSIETDANRIVLHGRLPQAAVHAIGFDGHVRIWLGAQSIGNRQAILARLSWIEPQSRASGRTSHAPDADTAVRFEISGTPATLPAGLSPGRRVGVTVPVPQQTLSELILAPIRRNLRLQQFRAS